MNHAEMMGSGLLTILVLIAIFVGNLIRHGASGCLIRRKERHLRRAARFGSMARWWDWFWPMGLEKYRELHAEELHEALCIRKDALAALESREAGL